MALKENVANLEVDMGQVESTNLLQDDRMDGQDDRLNLINAGVSDNENDIEGMFLVAVCTYRLVMISIKWSDTAPKNTLASAHVIVTQLLCYHMPLL